MCDTLVALSNSTRDGSVIFAKNSDREPNEAHYLLIVPAADHAEGEQLQCTYLQIPQVRHTWAVLLAKPFWIWGAEMGSNEHGLTIGNEAVFTRVPHEKAPALTGMDLLRLALERAATAGEALRLITALLETHGEGGSCGLTHPFYYHNSFLIADPTQAWILETAGRQWAARQVTAVGSISNKITIGSKWDLASTDLVNYAVDRGWCRQRQQFHFANCYSDFLYTRFSAAVSRQNCTLAALNASRGKISIETMLSALRSHRSASPSWSPAPALTGADVCMHAGWGPIRGSQTTGSMISSLTPTLQTHWLTATSSPCTSIFKPVWLAPGLPDLGPRPGANCDPDSLWWRHEKLHRETLLAYPTRLAAYRADRDRLEADFISSSAQLNTAAPAELKSFSEHCFRQASQAEETWLCRLSVVPANPAEAFYYRQAWQQFNQEARL